MLGLLKQKPWLDQNVSENMFEIFSWAMDNFDIKKFTNNTVLVLPNSHFFPDRSNNQYGMAKAIKERVLDYSGLNHWPFTLVSPEDFLNHTPPLLNLNSNSRSNQHMPSVQNVTLDTDVNELQLTYSPSMLKKPMDFVANMSTAIAQHALFQSKKIPPTGESSFRETAEVLSVFMGFGVLMANSAYTFRGSCAKCYDPRANRTAALPEHEVIYALAIYCSLKKEKTQYISKYLKPYLRASFKKALKQVQKSTSLNELNNKLNVSQNS